MYVMNNIQGRGTKNIHLQRLQTIFSRALLIRFTIMDKTLETMSRNQAKLDRNSKL